MQEEGGMSALNEMEDWKLKVMTWRDWRKYAESARFAHGTQFAADVRQWLSNPENIRNCPHCPYATRDMSAWDKYMASKACGRQICRVREEEVWKRAR